MKKLFKAIRHSDIDTVKEILENKPHLISCTAKQPPKKDDVNSEIMYGGLKVFHTKEDADSAYTILKRMIHMGADVNATDSYGNSCVWRACLQARQILPRYNHIEKKLESDRILTPELAEDLRRIFHLLYVNGMNVDYDSQGDKRTVRESYRNEPVAQFLNFGQ